MKAVDKKKLAAAMAAVDVYMEFEKGYDKPVVSVSFDHKQSPWALYGRTHSMNLRFMWQSKLYK